MATLYPVAGCRIYIGSAVDLPDVDVVAADFTSQTWVEIGGWETMGPMGDASQLITTPLISRKRDFKMKGTRNAGSMACNFAVQATNAGQIALIAAEATADNYAFKVELNDKPVVGASPKNSLRYFYGLVMGTPEQGGNANNPRMLACTIEINTNVVRVAASAT
jgi:hypothetical protein